MMNLNTVLTIALWATASLLTAKAQLSIPSDGSDEVLSVPAGENRVIDLAQAITGPWNTNNAAHAGQGVYDPQKWAVVFKYSSVNIQGNVTFANHPSRAPVVWLVAGNVAIAGDVNLSGQSGASGIGALKSPEPGPGGFRGGVVGPEGSGQGLGPGDASQHGNPQILPLIGGSGGGGYRGGSAPSGGGGGGAILIASSGEIILDGHVRANGGAMVFAGDAGGSGNGTGGAIKLIAQKILGNGQLEAYVPEGGPSLRGRIRLETMQLSSDLSLVPETIAVPPANPPIIWPPESAPTVRVLRVDGVDSPAEPTAPLARAADIALQNDKPVEIIIESTNFPLEGVVELQRVHKFGGYAGNWDRAVYVSGDFSRALWKVVGGFNGGFTVLQARATLP